MQTNPPRKPVLILILGLLTALSPFSIDMYLPAFPEMAADLKTSTSQVALSLSSYFIGLALGQLIYGPLLDRYGRKKPLYVGLLIYAIASLGCLWIQHIDSFIVLRFIQALGGCAAGVASMSMVRDNFSLKDSAKVLSLLVLILGLSPLIAPTAGGYVAHLWGWKTIFIFLTGISIFLLLISFFFLKESHRPDPSISLKPGPIFKNFFHILQQPQFNTYVLAGAASFAGLFVYVTGSPIIFMQFYGIDAQTYSWIFAFLSVGFIGSSQMNIWLLKKFKNESIFQTSLLVQVFVAVLFTISAYLNWLDVWGCALMLFAFLATVGLTNPNGAALALAPFSKNTGSAAALMGFLQMGAGALSSTAVGVFEATQLSSMVLMFLASSSIAVIILFLGKRRIASPIEIQDSNPHNMAH